MNSVLFNLKNSSVMITGATGKIGMAIIEKLIFLNENYNYNIKIIGLARNKTKIDCTQFNIDWIVQDIKEKINYAKKIDYLIHCAGPTDSLSFFNKPIETINTIYRGTKNILEYSKRNKIISAVFLSSLEIYGINNSEEKIEEKDYKYVDPLDVRSSYVLAKKLSENLCVSYMKEHNVPIKIARLTQVISKFERGDKRFINYLMESIIDKKQIILRTKGELKRNYISIEDTLNAIFFILIKGKSGDAYNVANENIYYSAFELASYVSQKFLGNKIKINEEQNTEFSKKTVLNLSTKKLRKLGWKPNENLDEILMNFTNFKMKG